MTKKPTRQQVENLGASYRQSCQLREKVFQYAELITKQSSPEATAYREELLHLETLPDFVVGTLLLADWTDAPAEYLDEIGAVPAVNFPGNLEVH